MLPTAYFAFLKDGTLPRIEELHPLCRNYLVNPPADNQRTRTQILRDLRNRIVLTRESSEEPQVVSGLKGLLRRDSLPSVDRGWRELQLPDGELLVFVLPTRHYPAERPEQSRKVIDHFDYFSVLACNPGQIADKILLVSVSGECGGRGPIDIKPSQN